MNPSGIFRISILQGGLSLREHLNTYPDFLPEEAIRQLQSGPSAYARYDYESAVEVANVHGWDVFAIIESRDAGLRSAISKLAKRLRPFWARMCTLGRDKVRPLLDPDAEQCLRDAKLLDTPLDSSCLEWWDDLASFFRAQKQELLDQIGRQAEELTIIYEREQLAFLGIPGAPEWISLEDNTVGYDVISYRKQGAKVGRIFIEVKGSTASPVRFFITRNEWDKAIAIGTSYFFYAWNIKTQELTIISVSSLVPDVPFDQGSGCWVKAEFSTSAFS